MSKKPVRAVTTTLPFKSSGTGLDGSFIKSGIHLDYTYDLLFLLSFGLPNLIYKYKNGHIAIKEKIIK